MILIEEKKHCFRSISITKELLEMCTFIRVAMLQQQRWISRDYWRNLSSWILLEEKADFSFRSSYILLYEHVILCIMRKSRTALGLF